MWLKAEGFVGLVKQWWDSYSFQGTPRYVLACKLKALKLDLKKWNEEIFGNVERNKKKLFEDLQALNAVEESRVLIEEELLKKAKLVRELEKCSLMEDVSWRQKSRVMWLKKGDKCTRFFHSIDNPNRRYNSMDSLLISNTPNQTEIGEHIVKFYQTLFTKLCRWRPMVDGLSFDFRVKHLIGTCGLETLFFTLCAFIRITDGTCGLRKDRISTFVSFFIKKN
jgi:hypothetical protein